MRELPPPPPGTAVEPGPGRDPAARMADGVLAGVAGLHLAIRALVWVLLWWVLAPLVIVQRTNGSNPGMGGALATLLVGGSFVLALVAGDLTTDPVAAEVGAAAQVPAEGDGVSRSPSPAPSTPPPPPSPSPSPSPPPSPSPSSTPAPSPRPSEESLAASPRRDTAAVVLQGRVVDVVDGDTIDLDDGTRVRIAIADTPEVHGGIEPCGPEASDFTGAFLAGETVAIYRLGDAPRTDNHGRTVGEVVRVTDGASLNVALVAAGLARVDERFTSEDPDLAARLRDAVATAATPGCAAPSRTDTAPEPEPEPEQNQEAAGDRHGGNVSGGYECHPAYYECLPRVGDLDCGDVGHSVRVLDPSDDPYRLDGNDNDGRGCESNPAWSSSRAYAYG